MSDVNTIFERVIAPERGDLSPEHARHVMRQGFTDDERARCEALSYKAQDGSLTLDEQRELDMFLAANAFLTALKAKAKRSLATHPSAA